MTEGVDPPVENQDELISVLRAVAALEEQRTPAEATSIAEETGLKLEVVKELMAKARLHELAYYFNELSGRTNSPIRSWGGWSVTESGHRFLEVTGGLP